MKSNFLLVAEALELGIPVEHNGQMYKLFQYEGKLPELKYAVIHNSNGVNTHSYIDDVPMKYMFIIARDLTDGDTLKLVHIIFRVKDELERGFSKEDITFAYEDMFFKKLEEIYSR